MGLLHTALSLGEAAAYAISGVLWWKGSRIAVPIVEPTWAGIDKVLNLSQAVSDAGWWNRWAAAAAAIGAGVHILGMAVP